MQIVKTTLLAASITGLTFGTGSVAADGAALFTAKLCMTCHGADAKTPLQPSYPRLSGQNGPYCEQQVKDIRDGKRTNGLTAAMKPLVAAVTDAEVTELCAYISSLPR